MLFNYKSVALAMLALVGSAAAADRKIIVGNNTLKFYPEISTAEVNDTIIFEWPAINKAPHSVVQAVGKDATCAKKDAATLFAATGPQNATYTFKFVIKDKSPVWFYCGVPNHCKGGMYGVINPPAGLTKLPPPSGGEAGTPTKPATPADPSKTSDTATPTGTSGGSTGNNTAPNSASGVARSGVMLGVVALAATFLL
jgi:plastocyanin